MKKIYPLLFTLLLIISLVSCDDSAASSEISKVNNKVVSCDDSAASSEISKANNKVSDESNVQNNYITIRFSAYSSNDDTNKRCIIEEAVIDDILSWTDETENMLSDEYIKTFEDTNSLHSELECYVIDLRHTESSYKNYYIIYVNDMDGYNFYYDAVRYSLPQEQIDKIIDIIKPLYDKT